jgi:hypothetical protein
VSTVALRTTRTETRLSASWRDRAYAEDRGPLGRSDEEEVAVGAGQTFFLGRRDRALSLEVESGEVRSVRPFAASFTAISAQASLAVSSRSVLFVLGARREDDYDHPESNLALAAGGPARHDVTWRATAGWLRRASARWSWSVRATHTQRESNVEFPPGSPLLDYERAVLSLGLRWSV